MKKTMVTPHAWFWRRVRAEWRFQWRVFKIAVDWIVALYIVIPAAVIVIYQYVSWWRSVPNWFGQTPLMAIAGILYLLGTIGTLRFFIEEGDQLFILQRPFWRRLQLRYGLIYSLVLHGVGTVIIVALASPFLYNRFDFSSFQLLLLTVFIFAVRTSRFAGLQILEVCSNSWGFAVYRVLVFSGGAVIFSLGVLACSQGIIPSMLCAGLSLLVLSLLVRLRLRLKGSYYVDVEREQRERMKYASLLLTGIIKKRPKRRRQRPLLFRSSKRLFRELTQENGLAEAAVKMLLRSEAKMKLYLLLTGFSIVGLLVIPAAVKPLLWIGVAVMMTMMNRSFWADSDDHDFLGLFHWKDGVRAGAMSKAIFAMTLPGHSILSIVYGLSLGWVDVPIVLVAGGFITYSASRVIGVLDAVKSKRIRS